MIWRNVIKGIIKASLPTIILPAIVVSFVIKYFGLTLDSFIAILFLGQFYIIWAQLEVALRQTHLTMLEYEPEFKIETKKTEVDKQYAIYLTNMGKHLVRNIAVSIDIVGFRCEHKFIPLTSLGRNETIFLCSFDQETLRNSVITIDINYVTALGEFGGTGFVKDPKLPDFIVSKRIRMPGILLNSFEDLLSIFHALTLHRRIKKYREKMKKTRNT